MTRGPRLEHHSVSPGRWPGETWTVYVARDGRFSTATWLAWAVGPHGAKMGCCGMDRGRRHPTLAAARRHAATLYSVASGSSEVPWWPDLLAEEVMLS